MTAKSLLIVGALTLTSIGVASAKSYDIVLSNPAKAGANELKAGEYKLKVDGTSATFVDSQSKSVTIPVKVENANKKFGYTSVESTNQDGMDTIHAIDLANTSTRLTVAQ